MRFSTRYATRFALLPLLLLMAAACSDSNPAGADGSNNGGSGGSNNSITDCTAQSSPCVTALIDGQAFASATTTSVIGVYVGNFLSVTGTDNANYSLTFSLFASGTGSNPIPGSGANAGQNAILSGVRGATSWSASPTQGSGTVTVSAITATTVAGRFSFTMPPTPNSSATGTKQITNGTFLIRY